QRKSSKAKEKKQKRLEERAAMDAVCAKVEAANKLEDPLEAFPVFKRYERNGLNVAIECKRGSGLEPATLEWAFELTKANMQSLCRFGVKPRDFGQNQGFGGKTGWFWGTTRGLGGRMGRGWGQIQVVLWQNQAVFGQNQGIPISVFPSTQMKKVMLTVFKHNHGAYQFFREALQFEVDATSPGLAGCCGD
ncbi:N-alpha-acetyltransferase 40, partial [Cuculus canorus]